MPYPTLRDHCPPEHLAAYDAALQRAARGPRARLVAVADHVDPDRCDGTMTCLCKRCSDQRALIQPQGEGNASPFRRARRVA